MESIAATAVGGLLLALVTLDVFLQVLAPEGRGVFGPWLLRTARRVARPAGRRGQVVAGPIALSSVLVAWVVVAVLGWTLVLVTRVPQGVSYGPGIERHGSIIDASYMSFVTLTTLGFGDVTPSSPGLRLLLPLAAAMGFGLLTAGLAWILSTYRPLSNQRTLARQVAVIEAPADVSAGQLDQFAADVAAATVSLKLTPVTYYLEPRDPDESLAVAAVRLHRLVERWREDPGSAPAAARIGRLLDQLADQLAERHPAIRAGTSTRDRLRCWVRDAGLDPDAH